MTKFILVYYGGNQPASKEEGMAHMAAWKAWMEGLGNAIVDPGMPARQSKTVSANGVSDAGNVSGITIVQADTLHDAITMAQACPHIGIGGSIEVAEAMDMQM